MDATPAGQTRAPLQDGNWQGSFWSLIATQFQGAFNENALKNLVIFLIVAAGFSEAKEKGLASLVNELFSVPFILFSMFGGFLADRYSKRSVTISTKVFEVGVTLIALAGLWLNNLPVQLAAVFLVCTQGALFGPSKYGLLPELLSEKRLSWGNGVLELGTFVAIILGNTAGAILSTTFRGHQEISGVIFLALTLIGLWTSTGIRRIPAADPERKLQINFLSDLWTQWKYIRRDRVLFLAVIGNTYFYLLSALLVTNIVFFGADVLKISPTHIGYLQAVTAIGIGLGSLAAGYLSGNKIEYGLVPLGAIGMTVFGALLSRAGTGLRGAAVELALLGFFGGFFAVPVNAMIQHRPERARRGGVLAAANLLSFVGVALSGGLFYLFTLAHFTPAGIFLGGAVLTGIATAYVLYLLPDALLRLLLWFLTHTLYSIRVEGRDNVPEKGGALFVCNHLSFVDALLLSASTDRAVRFVMFKGIYDHPVVHPFARIAKCIPISAQLRPREMIKSLRTATEAIQSGDVVCIFAEGQITRIGHLLPFRRGFERIMKGVDAPIIPVNLDGVWGSIFSFELGRFLWKLPRQIPFPVTVSFGKPMAAQSTPSEVRAAVQALETEAYAQRRRRMRPLHRALLRTARKHPFRFALADGRTPRVNWGTALVKSIVLARKLRLVWRGQKMVGVLMPPSVAGAVVNFAAVLMGKVPVNLNYTASNEVLEACARQCELKMVITSAAFLERVPNVKPPAQAVLLEEVAANIRAKEKLAGLLLAWFAPATTLFRVLGREPGIHLDPPAGALAAKDPALDDLATIIFSSGSTGDPKGVMLSHYNIAANVEQMGQMFMLRGDDKILGILPFFHSFGFTATMWLPAMLGVGAVYHPNPLDSRAIGQLVQNYGVSLMVATPTFLQAYIRRCMPEEFGSLQYVIVGAEKLPDRVSLAFEDAFGLKPLEGYGCTECSPVVAVNTKDFRAVGFRQVGFKRGRIGHPLPGISVKILDPETLQPLAIGQPGLLFVKGPNVMCGYLGRPDKTAAVLQDGWYNTGDIASIDEDGFLTIADRLSRFSKIAGEMVPHVKVEDKLHELASATEQTFAVTSVADERKGERLIVLHTLAPEALEPVLKSFAECELPPLWKPRANQFVRVEALPYLGTGKLDLRRMKELAAEMTREKSASAN